MQRRDLNAPDAQFLIGMAMAIPDTAWCICKTPLALSPYINLWILSRGLFLLPLPRRPFTRALLPLQCHTLLVPIPQCLRARRPLQHLLQMLFLGLPVRRCSRPSSMATNSRLRDPPPLLRNGRSHLR